MTDETHARLNELIASAYADAISYDPDTATLASVSDTYVGIDAIKTMIAEFKMTDAQIAAMAGSEKAWDEEIWWHALAVAAEQAIS